MNIRTSLTIISNKLLVKANLHPFFLHLPLFGLNKIEPAFKYFEDLIYAKIDQVQGSKAEDSKNDILSLLVKAGNILTPLEILSDTFMFYFAGHETTAYSTNFALYCIAKYKNIQEKILEEVKEVAGTEALSYNHATKLTYTKCVFKEVLRFFPPVINVPKQVHEEITLNGVKIPPKVGINIAVYAVHFNPKYWENPSQFNPDRFLSDNIHPYAFLPFSAGNRSCIGMKFALIEATMILAGLVRNFELSLEEDDGKELEVSSVVTLRADKPLRIVLKNRQ